MSTRIAKRILLFPFWMLSAFINRTAIYANTFRALAYSGIHPSVVLGSNCAITGPKSAITIGKGTYLNGAHLMASKSGAIYIGRDCCIGYRVSIKAWTHDKKQPCHRVDGEIKGASKNIKIGDRVWIGDGVFIKEGVEIGDDCIIGANAVVTRSFPNGCIIAGVPGKVIGQK